MRKASATYIAPAGDNKVVEMGGVTFFDGQSIDLNSDDHAHLINKLPTNQHFDIEVGEDDTPEKPRRGRPPNPKQDDQT
jgi:hypothetical protein